jgi:carboxyl-terminal processing protease
MTSRSLTHRIAALLAVLAPLQSSVRADTDFGQVAIYVAHMLENTHISHKVFDNDLSSKVLDSYLDFLDPRHQIFTQQDVDGFKAAYKDTLDDSVMLRDISPATKIYNVYKERVKERVNFAKETLKKPEVFTFDSDRSVDLKREKLPWPNDKAAADALWPKTPKSPLRSACSRTTSASSRTSPTTRTKRS